MRTGNINESRAVRCQMRSISRTQHNSSLREREREWTRWWGSRRQKRQERSMRMACMGWHSLSQIHISCVCEPQKTDVGGSKLLKHWLWSYQFNFQYPPIFYFFLFWLGFLKFFVVFFIFCSEVRRFFCTLPHGQTKCVVSRNQSPQSFQIIRLYPST